MLTNPYNSHDFHGFFQGFSRILGESCGISPSLVPAQVVPLCAGVLSALPDLRAHGHHAALRPELRGDSTTSFIAFLLYYYSLLLLYYDIEYLIIHIRL